MGMLDFLKDDPDEELDDVLDDDFDDADLDDEDFLDEDDEKSSKKGLLSRFKKTNKDEEEDREPEPSEEAGEVSFSDYTVDRHSFKSDYQSMLIRQSQQARNNLERRTLAALEEIRRIAGQEPVIDTSRNTAGYDGEETDDYDIGE